MIAIRRPHRPGRLTLTVLCSLLALLFPVAGCLKLAATDLETHSLSHFGYARWFMVAIGAIELGMATPAAVMLALCMLVAYAKRRDFTPWAF